MAQTKTEFELKLVGPASDVAAVCERRFAGAAASGGSWERLVSTYYDSADRRLAATGLSLRIREEAGVSTLTAKLTPQGAACVQRLEAERRLDGAAPDFRTGAGDLDRLIGARTDDLLPIARTTTDRWSQLIEDRGALVEVAADIGAAENLIEKRRDAIAEIEIELMKGAADAVFEIAGRLIADSEGRLRLSVETKLDRALRAGDPPRPGKLQRIPYAQDASAADCLGGALQQVSVQIVEAASLLMNFRQGDAARRLRVALRRLRAIERIFRKSLAPGELASLASRARSLARLVGAARDIDVFIAQSLPLAPAPPMYRAHLEGERARLFNDASRALSGAEFGAFAIDLFRAAYLQSWRADAGRHLDMPAREFADLALQRRWSRLGACAEGVDFASPPSLHALRLDLKKFRYSAQFFRDFYASEERKPFFGAMSALQQALGEINDAVAAQEIAESAARGLGPAAARAAGFIAGYRSAQAAAAAQATEARWRTFAAAPRFWEERAGLSSTDDR